MSYTDQAFRELKKALDESLPMHEHLSVETRIQTFHQELIKLAVLNISLTESALQVKACGLIQAAGMIRNTFPEVQLPDARLEDFSEVCGKGEKNPDLESLVKCLPTHIAKSLGHHQSPPPPPAPPMRGF